MESLKFGILGNFGNGNRDEENEITSRITISFFLPYFSLFSSSFLHFSTNKYSSRDGIRIWNIGKFFENCGNRDEENEAN